MADKKTAKDHASEIGKNFSLEKANEMFGKNGLKAFQAVAEAGGYGTFNALDAQDLSLAIDPKNKEVGDAINSALAKFK